jgi:hypothetical protein
MREFCCIRYATQDKPGTAVATSAHMISRQMTDAYQPNAGSAGFKTAGSFWAGVGVRFRQTMIALFKLPAGAASRVLILLIGLVSVKLALLIGSAKHLHEIHWRVGGPPSGWTGYAVFFAFIGLGVWSLVELSRHCRAVGIKAVRTANVVVLTLALLFFFLTFHEGENNYLYPVMTGTLKWKNLGPYLSLNFFFRPPFLAAWIFGYALLYYFLARTGRESRVIHLTAVFTGAYALLCLRELINYRDSLVVAGCFGLAALVCLRRPDERLKAIWLLVPLAWVLCAWALFFTETYSVRNPKPYFLLITGISVALFVGAILLARAGGYLQFWLKLTPFYFAAFFLLANNNYPLARNYNNLLCYAFQYPHYFFGELLLAGLLAVCAAVYCRMRPGGNLLWMDVLGLVLVATALIDFRLSQVMGVRLGWDLLSFGHSPKMMWRMALPYLPSLALMITGIIVAYALSLRYARTWLGGAAAAGPRPGKGGWYVAACFALLAATGVVFVKPDNAEGQAALRLAQTSPWWNHAAGRALSREEFLNTAITLGLGDFQKSLQATPMRDRRELNVVLVFMESSNNKHLSLFSGSEDTQPLLSKYKDRMEIFPNVFANFASSIHARFAAFTSLYPASDYNLFTLKRVGVKSIFEVLHENDYACSMFYSSYFDYTGFRDFLQHRGIGEMFDADTMPGQRTTKGVSWGLHEEETLGAIRHQIQKHAGENRKFFLTYVPAAPHYPYDSIPEAFRKYKLKEYRNFEPLYLNELLYMDWVITSIVDQLKESRLLDKTLVIITADHGEMLGGNGSLIGHGWAVTPELANVPLIIMDPGKPGYRINETIGSQVDLLPTVLDILGISVPPGELYEGRSLYAVPERGERLIYLNSYRQYGVIAGKHLMLGDRTAERGDATDANKTVYLISNDGSKTRFTEDFTATNHTVSIRRFDKFQESLLRNYSLYRDSISERSQGNAQYAKP